MDRLPPDTSRNPEINEATPLLHDEACAIDADLYAIGGATGFSEEPINEPQTDIDSIVKEVFLECVYFPISMSGKPIWEDPELFSLLDLHAVSTAWQQIKAERDVLPESEVIVQRLAESMADFMNQLQLVEPYDIDSIKEAFTAHVAKIVSEEHEQKRARKKKERQQNRDEIEEENEQERARQKKEKQQRQQVLVGIGKDEQERARQKKERQQRQQVLVGIGKDEQESTRQKKERQHRQQVLVGIDEENEWKTAGKKKERQQREQILDGIEREDEQEKSRKEKERRQRYRERMRRRQEIANVLWFYEPIASTNFNIPMDCRVFCINLCLCCSVFIFQIIIHTLLLLWPLSIGIMGGLYMTQCPMSFLMPYMMIAVGVAGTIAHLTRLSFVTYEKFSGNEILIWWPWILLKVMEFVYLVFLVIQLYCFFSKTPSFVARSPEYCNETFYNFVHWINYVSIAFASVWLLVYFIKGILTWQLRKYSLRPW